MIAGCVRSRRIEPFRTTITSLWFAAGLASSLGNLARYVEP
jgi:hypothetical protein